LTPINGARLVGRLRARQRLPRPRSMRPESCHGAAFCRTASAQPAMVVRRRLSRWAMADDDRHPPLSTSHIFAMRCERWLRAIFGGCRYASRTRSARAGALARFKHSGREARIEQAVARAQQPARRRANAINATSPIRGPVRPDPDPSFVSRRPRDAVPPRTAMARFSSQTNQRADRRQGLDEASVRPWGGPRSWLWRRRTQRLDRTTSSRQASMPPALQPRRQCRLGDRRPGAGPGGHRTDRRCGRPDHDLASQTNAVGAERPHRGAPPVKAGRLARGGKRGQIRWPGPPPRRPKTSPTECDIQNVANEAINAIKGIAPSARGSLGRHRGSPGVEEQCATAPGDHPLDARTRRRAPRTSRQHRRVTPGRRRGACRQTENRLRRHGGSQTQQLAARSTIFWARIRAALKQGPVRPTANSDGDVWFPRRPTTYRSNGTNRIFGQRKRPAANSLIYNGLI